MSKVAVVTGANRGIGLEVVKQIAEANFEGIIYLTGRNEESAQVAVENLSKGNKNEKVKILSHQLDVTDEGSIETLKKYLEKEHGGIDILVNNAGVYASPALQAAAKGGEALGVNEEIESLKYTIGINYYGVKSVTNALLPLLKPHARLVTVASRAGNIKELQNEEIKKLLLSEALTNAQIDKIAEDYLNAANIDGGTPENFPNPYATSKIFAIAFTIALQKELELNAKEDIVANACCPGFVATDMTAPMREAMNLKVGDQFIGDYMVKSIADGADTVVYLALLPENVDSPKGKFVAERKILSWEDLKPVSELQKEARDELFAKAQILAKKEEKTTEET